MISAIKLNLLSLLVLALATVSFASGAAAQERLLDDGFAIGNADAPVTVVEYFSLTCPHCARFHIDTMPTVVSTYVETGKVRFIYRDFPLDNVALGAALVARCIEGKGYYRFIQLLFEQQQNWATAEDPIGAVTKLGRLAGLSEERIRGCLSDQKAVESIVAGQNQAVQEFKVNATPSFVINGRTIAGAISIAEFEEIVDPLLN